MHGPVGKVDRKDGARLWMTRNCEDLPTLVQEEDADRHVEVGVAGLLVVVEDADSVLRSAEHTPPLLPALRC